MMFKKTEKPIKNPLPTWTETTPPLIAKMEADYDSVLEQIRMREDELRTLNIALAELGSEIAWLKRTPQAVRILTKLSERLKTGE